MPHLEMDSVKFEGLVEKTSGLFKNKTQIWMVLENLSVTHYKDSKKTFCVGSIDVNEVQTARQTGQKRGREFEVTTKSTTYKFTVETDELAAAWVNAIQQSMLQKVPSRNQPYNRMASSEYAQICDISPATDNTTGRSRIYEEIGETTRERNIFGVQLKSSFHRAHRSSSRSSSDSTSPESLDNNTKSPPVSEQENVAESREEPIYAKPDKSKPSASRTADKTPAGTRENTKQFNKPRPPFSPPPPPTKTNMNVTDTPSASVTSTEQPKSLSQPNLKVDNDVIDINDGTYSTIEAIAIKGSARGSADPDTAVYNDDEHEYYFADSIPRDPSDKSAVQTTEAETRTDLSSTDGATSTATDLRSEAVVEMRNKQSSGAYEEVDISQVMRRTRGSHVTISFSEDSPNQPEEDENLRASRKGVQSPASVRRRNFRNSKQDEEIAGDNDENNEVFVNNDAHNVDQGDELYEKVEYKAFNLKAVVSSLVSTTEADDFKLDSFHNGKAFQTLKQYLESHTQEGFDIDTHIVSSNSPIERLQALLNS